MTSTHTYTHRERIFQLVSDERDRQDAKFGLAPPSILPGDDEWKKLAVLGEECGHRRRHLSVEAVRKQAELQYRLRLDRYGLTPEQNQALNDAFPNCVLCLKRFTKKRLRARDHDHNSGLVRGVPCVQCNLLIGALHEDVGWFTRAAAYLTNPPAVAIIGEVYVPNSRPR